MLVLCSHGTRSAEGRAAVAAMVAAVGARSDEPVRDAYVDIHGPTLEEVLVPDAVVVPLLLAPGYHVHVDIAEAAAAVPGVRVGRTLGPSAPLVEVLVDRLAVAGLRAGDAVVLAAAGSSDDAAAVSVQETARLLSVALDRPVPVAYGASREPRVPEEVARLRAAGAERVVIASYLLATGHFHRRLLAARADAVSGPLVDEDPVDPRLVGLVLARRAEASEPV